MAQQDRDRRIDQFFSGPGARADEWRALVEAAKAWSNGTQDRAGFEQQLAQLAISEEYHACPGPRLTGSLKERAAAGDAAGALTLATRITHALQTRSFRQHAGDWNVHADDDTETPVHGHNAMQGLKLVRPEALARFGDRRQLASFRPAVE
jgi:arginine decarboxylase